MIGKRDNKLSQEQKGLEKRISIYYTYCKKEEEKMTVKEYLEIHGSKDIQSIGIYSATLTKDDFGRDTDVIEVEVTAISIIDYLDREIDHVILNVCDEVKKSFNGGEYTSHHIRACIYVK